MYLSVMPCRFGRTTSSRMKVHIVSNNCASRPLVLYASSPAPLGWTRLATYMNVNNTAIAATTLIIKWLVMKKR